ncbi:serine/threonine-protein phosphatase 4 regulatory subunit 2 [Fopius arisanus]|uniref:Serine/threonine-protein phosphatase 4 regulatory subunit 2 n=1 Tax=Fopius arisanus TaxID=64838 RepID=A0A9R1TFA3_9HYME|nr:PREDICTED: serine/threonine-protein phosphatase 4 regulatory subunit 2 [Fopius arisanus]
MENPEEVLQALDEFQKLRPSEIPRELEDYLCFVAKTGDPVYQWSLIKPLFREKLVRVMTDFYESCPTLDLAASPNIEQFNYDSMKGNLLDLLESFANAPFTVQRICELLTSPRKEYNRVDKFMRAIEKNILVVSTREPGPAARRSENGDSMINGSMDEESSATHHEVEMESWVKDCTGDVPEEADPKRSEESVIQEKQEPRGNLNNFSDTSGTLSSSQHEPTLCSNPQNAVPDVSGIVGDVPEAIMNEDTSSQPSLDSESDDSDLSNSRKLTFQSRDFGKDKPEERIEERDEERAGVRDDDKADEKDEKDEEKATGEDEKPLEEVHKVEQGKLNFGGHQHPDLSIDDPILEKRARLDDGTSSETDSRESVVIDSSEMRAASPGVKGDPLNSCEGGDDKSEGEAPVAEPQVLSGEENDAEPEPEVPEVERNHEGIETDFQELPEHHIKGTNSTEPEVITESKKDEQSEQETVEPIVEEPTIEEPERDEEAEETGGVVIQEAMDDDTKSGNTMVPDPIPIIEEPKEESFVTSTEETSIAEIVEAKSPVIGESDNEVGTSKEGLVDVEELCEPLQQDNIDDVSVVERANEEEKEVAVSMDVDSEDAMPIIQQDEPMEEESGDQLKS